MSVHVSGARRQGLQGMMAGEASRQADEARKSAVLPGQQPRVIM